MKIVDEIDPYSNEYNILGGEPLIYDHIWEVIGHVRQKGRFFTVSSSLTTIENMRRLEDAGVYSISVSVDTFDFALSPKSKCGKLALDNWRGKGPNFCGIVVSPQNQDDVLKVAKYASGAGWLCCINPANGDSADTQFGRRSIGEISNLLKVRDELLREAEIGNVNLTDPLEYYQTWDNLWKCFDIHSIAVDSDGSLYPCMSLAGVDTQYNIGNLNEFIDQYTKIIKNCSGCNMNASWVANVMPEGLY